jgi:hypothetical protein
MYYVRHSSPCSLRCYPLDGASRKDSALMRQRCKPRHNGVTENHIVHKVAEEAEKKVDQLYRTVHSNLKWAEVGQQGKKHSWPG